MGRRLLTLEMKQPRPTESKYCRAQNGLPAPLEARSNQGELQMWLFSVPGQAMGKKKKHGGCGSWVSGQRNARSNTH